MKAVSMLRAMSAVESGVVKRLHHGTAYQGTLPIDTTFQIMAL